MSLAAHEAGQGTVGAEQPGRGQGGSYFTVTMSVNREK